MKLPLDFTPEAQLDIIEIYDWLEMQEPGLGDRFRSLAGAYLSGLSERLQEIKVHGHAQVL